MLFPIELKLKAVQHQFWKATIHH